MLLQPALEKIIVMVISNLNLHNRIVLYLIIELASYLLFYHQVSSQNSSQQQID